METLHQFTIDWFTEQSQNASLAPEITADLARILDGQSNGKSIPAPTPVGYLVARANTVEVSVTNGKWNRKKHEQLCKSGVDGDFENWNTVGKKDKPTSAINALPHDLVKDGTYMQIIPDVPENFFQNAEQAMQAVHDNPALQEEVLKQDHRLHLPFVDADGNKFVANVFRRVGALGAGVYEFLNDYVWNASYGNVFVFPQQPSES